MIGLLLKDVYNLSKQLRIYLIFPFVAAFFGYQNGNFQMVSMILSYLSLFIVLSACAYDEQSNFDSYALTLPLTRKDLVLSKYVLSFLSIFTIACISLVTCGLLNLLFADRFSNTNWQELIITVVVIAIAINLLLCVLLPMIFKFGSEKARILLMIVFLSFAMLAYFISTLDMTWISTSIFPFLEQWGLYVVAIIVIIGEVISIMIANHIYTKKEF